MEVYVPKDGEYSFSVTQDNLLSATKITNYVSNACKASLALVKVTLFETSLRLSLVNQVAFVEVSRDTITSVEKDYEGVSFIFDQATLHKVSNLMSSDSISFVFKAETQELLVSSGKTQLNFPTFLETDVIDYSRKLNNLKSLGGLNIGILKEGVKYCSTFCKRNDLAPVLSIVDLKKGAMVSGNPLASGVFHSSEFKDTTVKFKHEVLSTVDSILSDLDPSDTILYETPTYYVLKDSKISFGFERTNLSFPPVDRFLKDVQSKDFILSDRNLLINTLKRLSVVSKSKNLLVNLKIRGEGVDAIMIASTKDSSGKKSTDEISVERIPLEGVQSDFKMQEINLDLFKFLESINQFKSEFVHVEIVNPEYIHVKENTDAYNAVTILSVLSSDKAKELEEVDNA